MSDRKKKPLKKRPYHITFLYDNQVHFIDYEGKPGIAFDKIPSELKTRSAYEAFLFQDNDDLLKFAEDLVFWAKERKNV